MFYRALNIRSCSWSSDDDVHSLQFVTSRIRGHNVDPHHSVLIRSLLVVVLGWPLRSDSLHVGRTMRSCTRAHPPTVPACAHPFFVEMRVMANVVGSSKEKRINYQTGVEQPTKVVYPTASANPDRTHFTTLTVAPRGRPRHHPQTTSPGHPRADDLPGPSACRRPPRSIRVQTTSPAIRVQTTSGPSACRRPPGHPRADDLRAIRVQTTSGPSACRRPPGHPRADDLRAIRVQTTSGPSACRRPPGHPRADDLRAIRVQTTSGPSACRRPPGHFTCRRTSGPSACRRPPGHPHADDPIKTSPANTWRWRSALLQLGKLLAPLSL